MPRRSLIDRAIGVALAASILTVSAVAQEPALRLGNNRLQRVPAHVISTGGGEALNTIEIDRGSDHGVGPEMMVLNKDGLIGKTTAVGRETATVLLITHKRSRVGAAVGETRIEGVLLPRLSSPGTQPELALIRLPKSADLQPGQKVYTSGACLFPKGILIGSITELQVRETDAVAKVAPAVSFAALQDVIVVPPVPPPSASSAHAEVVAYIMDRKGEAHGMGNGRIHYVVSAGLGELIAKDGRDLLREAVTLYSDAPYPPNPSRLEELAVLVLSGVKPEGAGWISEKRRQEGAVVFKVPLATNEWLCKRFPKERTAAEWTKFLETFDNTRMPEVSEPTEFTVLTSPPRRGTRYRLLFLQSSLDNYRK